MIENGAGCIVSWLFRITRNLRCQKHLWHGFCVFLRRQSKFGGSAPKLARSVFCLLAV